MLALRPVVPSSVRTRIGSLRSRKPAETEACGDGGLRGCNANSTAIALFTFTFTLSHSGSQAGSSVRHPDLASNPNPQSPVHSGGGSAAAVHLNIGYVQYHHRSYVSAYTLTLYSVTKNKVARDVRWYDDTFTPLHSEFNSTQRLTFGIQAGS